MYIYFFAASFSNIQIIVYNLYNICIYYIIITIILLGSIHPSSKLSSLNSTCGCQSAFDCLFVMRC